MSDDSGERITIEQNEDLRVRIESARNRRTLFWSSFKNGVGYGLIVGVLFGVVTTGTEFTELVLYAALLGFVPTFVLVGAYTFWTQLSTAETAELTVSADRLGLKVTGIFGPRLDADWSLDDVAGLHALEMSNQSLRRDLPPDQSHSLTLLVPGDMHTFAVGLGEDDAERIVDRVDEFIHGR